MIKIAICGKANSGKNTLSKMLTKEIRRRQGWLGVSYVAFADPIKKMLQIMYPQIPRKYLFSSSKFRSEIIPGAFKDGQPLTIRQALMDIGTELGRRYSQSTWLDVFDSTFKELSYSKIFIVPDLRFKNEFDHLRSKGFFIIKIHRNNASDINHESETSQDQISDSQFDYVLLNNGSKNDLKFEVQKIVDLIV